MVLGKAGTSVGLSMCFISSLLFHLFITSLLFLGAEVLVGCVRPHVQVSYSTCQNPCKMKTPSWAGVGKVNVPFPRAHSARPQQTADPRGMATFMLVHTCTLSLWMSGQETLQIGTLSLGPKGSFLESHPQMPWGGHICIARWGCRKAAHPVSITGKIHPSSESLLGRLCGY